MLRHLNIEKATKWFLNLTSDKMIQDSPSKVEENWQKKNGKTQKNKEKNTKTKIHCKKTRLKTNTDQGKRVKK